MNGNDGMERATDPAEIRGGGARAPVWYGQRTTPVRQESANLADILERILDKGIIIAGDIQVNLLDIELLTIKLRLVIASVDRAREMGIDWWEHDPTLSSGQRELVEENRRLRDQVRELESGRGTRGAIGRGDKRTAKRSRERTGEERDRG